VGEGELLDGIVIRVHAKNTIVDRHGESVRCTVRGRFFENLERSMRPVAVGDRVRFRITGKGEGAIEEILPRRTKLSRPGIDKGGKEQVIAANVDQVVVVASIKNPPFRPGLVDRIFVAGRSGGLDTLLVLNKADEGAPDEIGELIAPYREIGVTVLVTSAASGEGIADLRQALADRTSVFSGPSGAGKSSLINAVQPGLRLRVGAVSDRTRKGRHTTTAVALLPLECGGYVVDTPGVREFGLWDVSREELDAFFPEIAPLAERCRFRRCSHVHEPDCAVKQALEGGAIRHLRYESYTRILETLD